MSDERCPRCDRVECRQPALWAQYNALWENSRGVVTETMKQVQREFNEADKECYALKVDWRPRALAAEEKLGNPLMVICNACNYTGLAANHHHTCPSPTPEVLRAADEVAQLAEQRTMLRDEQTKAPPREQDYIAHLLDAAEDRMVQLAVVLAEWVKGGGR